MLVEEGRRLVWYKSDPPDGGPTRYLEEVALPYYTPQKELGLSVTVLGSLTPLTTRRKDWLLNSDTYDKPEMR